MSKQVLLVDADVEALGELASELRKRGLIVSLADSAKAAVTSARNKRPDVVLVASALDAPVRSLLQESRQTADIPCFGLGDEAESTADRLPRRNPNAVATRIYALRVAGPAAVAEGGDFRGDLLQVPLPDLLQLLIMNRRTGVLSVTTPAGAGEVRLTEGEIVDAVYRRIEGEKALFRLLVEPEGKFAFATGAASAMRRITTSAQVLLMEGLRQVDELRDRRTRLVADDDALLLVAPPPDDGPTLEHRVAEMLAVPRTLDELLDDVPESDLEVLGQLERMLESGAVRRVPSGAVHAELAESDRMNVFGALVRRLSRGGFAGAPRLVFAAAPERLAMVIHAVRRIAGASAPAESSPAAPVPYVLATIKIADAELDIVGLPAIDAYSPLWGLALPGSIAVIRLQGVESTALEEACSANEVRLLDAGQISPDLDEADPTQMAALITSALDAFADA